MNRLAVLALSHAFMDCMLNVVPPLTPFLARDYGLSLAQLGAVAMMASLSSGLLQPVLGAAVDRLGTSRPFPWTVLWAGAFAGLVGWAPTFPALLAAVFLLGIGGAFFHPLGAVIVPRAAERFAASKATAMSIFSFGGTIGIALAPVLFAFLAYSFGLRGVLWVVVPAGLIALANLVVGNGKIPTGPEEGSAGAHGAHGGAAHPGLPDRPEALFWLCAAMTLRLVLYGAVLAFLPLLFVERGYSETRAGLLLAGFLFTGSAGAILGARLSDFWGRRAVTAVSAFLIPPGVLGFLFLDGALSLACLGVAALTIFATFSAVVIYAQELLPSRKAQAAGLVMGFVWALASLATPAVGGVADRFGLAATLAWLTPAPLVAGFIALKLPETLPPRRRALRRGAAGA